MKEPLRIVIIGLSITSSWGNGHATTYRGLVKELVRRGHSVTFLERDVPWYATHRDLPDPPYGTTHLYRDLSELLSAHAELVRNAHLVVVGSYLPQGIEVGDWVQRTAGGATAFYDIDTPVTLAQLAAGTCEYLEARQIPGYPLYLSVTGGPTLELIQRRYGAPLARPLYCSFDAELYYPEPQRSPRAWDLGYMGTYSDDRQAGLERLLINPARRWGGGRFMVAGPGYQALPWPANVKRIEYLPPGEQRRFYNAQRFTLNVTRAATLRVGWSPSARLFEAAACATAIISDAWPGLDSVLRIGSEVLVARSAREVEELLVDMPDEERRKVGLRGRLRVLAEHGAAHRAIEVERLAENLLGVRTAA